MLACAHVGTEEGIRSLGVGATGSCETPTGILALWSSHPSSNSSAAYTPWANPSTLSSIRTLEFEFAVTCLLQYPR